MILYNAMYVGKSGLGPIRVLTMKAQWNFPKRKPNERSKPKSNPTRLFHIRMGLPFSVFAFIGLPG